MTIRYTCLACRQPMQADNSEIGQKVACENCGLRFPAPKRGDYTMWIVLAVVFAILLIMGIPIVGLFYLFGRYFRMLDHI